MNNDGAGSARFTSSTCISFEVPYVKIMFAAINLFSSILQGIKLNGKFETFK